MDKIIKYYRERINLSQKEVAKKLGVSPQRFFVIENTDNVPAKYLEQLCDLFKVRKEILFKELAAKNKYIAPEEVTYYREKKNLTKQQLAIELDTYHTYVYNWEKGKFTPGEKNAEQLTKYLEIPDYIIFPDIIEYDSEHAILELKDCLLIVGKEPLKYSINLPFKKTIYAYLFSDCLYELQKLNPGERPLYPVILNSDADSLMIEFESYILIVTPYPLSELEMNAARLHSKKDIIYAINDKLLLLILSLKEDLKNNYFFYKDLEIRLKNIFSSVTQHELEHEIICSTPGYFCIISYTEANDEIIFVNDVVISFSN